MGRMNNSKTQSKNAEVLNKSARARFSTWKPPPKKKGGKGDSGGGRGDGGGGRGDGATGRGGGGGGRGRTLDTIISRASQRERLPTTDTAAAELKRRALLNGVVLEDLEVVTLSQAHQALVTQLLADHGIVDDIEAATEQPRRARRNDEDDEDKGEDEDDAATVDEVAAPTEKEAAAIFSHLTKRLSFTDDRAFSALKGVGAHPSLGDALDWLCLRLGEKELAAALKKRPVARPAPEAAPQGGPARVVTQVAVVKGGGGISLAGSYDDWVRSAALGGIEAMGFSAAESKKALQACGGSQDRAVRALLDGLVSTSTKSAKTWSEAELQIAATERTAEVAALRAIFGDAAVRLEAVGKISYVRVNLDAKQLNLEPPARDAPSTLSLVLRDGGEAYPLAWAPLLFENDILPPGCSRRILEQLATIARAGAGHELVYDATQWLYAHAREVQRAFVDEKRKALAAGDILSPPPEPKKPDPNKAAPKVAPKPETPAEAEDRKAEERMAMLRRLNSPEPAAPAAPAAPVAQKPAGKPAGKSAGKSAPKAADAPRAGAKGTKDAPKANAGEAPKKAKAAAGLSASNMPEDFAPSPMLLEIMGMVGDTAVEQPWLVSSEARTTPMPPPPPAAAAKAPAKAGGSDAPKATTAKQDKDFEASEHRENERLYRELEEKQSDEKYLSMMRQRSKLPAYEMRETVVGAISASRVVVISGDTGCGKTTQVPQLVLDDAIRNKRGARCSVVITQPRRISAMGVAARIAAERNEKIGVNTVGYSIRGESKRCAKTRVLLCTTGVVLRRLQCDPDLATLSHVFVDEVHERDLSTDFLLIILRRLMRTRKSLKIVLMSATLNAAVFRDYFAELEPKLVTIPGRAHPVRALYLEDALALTAFKVDPRSDCRVNPKRRPTSAHTGLAQKDWAQKLPKHRDGVHLALSILDPAAVNYDLIASLVEQICAGAAGQYVTEDADGSLGGILIFMPGMLEISNMTEKLKSSRGLKNAVVYALHSGLATDEQTQVFDRPPKGTRKVVVSTNIAETSITIDDVVYVIDCAKVKESRYDADRGMATLEEVFVSRAAARQRRGRAGRVRAGVAWHLVSEAQHDDEMDAYPQPEMLRTSLEDIVLQILVLDLGSPQVFLDEAVDPPLPAAVRRALELLAGIDALEPLAAEGDKGDTRQPALTALGYHLASLPLEPRVGKLLLVGAMLGIAGAAMTLAAVMTSPRGIFVAPLDQRDRADEARRDLAVAFSDHLTGVAAFDAWRLARDSRDERRWAREHFCGLQTLQSVEKSRIQFAEHLQAIGFIGKAQVRDLLKQPSRAILCAGLFPNVLQAPRDLVRKGGTKTAGEVVDDAAYLHPGCLSHTATALDNRCVVYREIVRTTKVYVRDATTVAPLALLLFGGALTVHHDVGVISVDKKLHFKAPPKIATLVKVLRAELEALMLRKIAPPKPRAGEEDAGGKGGKGGKGGGGKGGDRRDAPRDAPRPQIAPAHAVEPDAADARLRALLALAQAPPPDARGAGGQGQGGRGGGRGGRGQRGGGR
ncbi:P-loop containing nucleoside triphosphate hydrolase protein [Pelagophyceae sp. CCMP2097]|nr:P-loop containing nucleoside triphosphate hydrolase protein [Pelagophyceae sp. CCMP2097]